MRSAGSLGLPTVLAVVVVALFGSLQGVTGRTASPPPATPHPIVGTWETTSNYGSLYTFFGDGNALATDRDGTIYLGAWKPGGRDLITYGFHTVGLGPGGQGFYGAIPVAAGAAEIRDPLDETETATRIVAPSPDEVLSPNG